MAQMAVNGYQGAVEPEEQGGDRFWAYPPELAGDRPVWAQESEPVSRV